MSFMAELESISYGVSFLVSRTMAGDLFLRATGEARFGDGCFFAPTSITELQ